MDFVHPQYGFHAKSERFSERPAIHCLAKPSLRLLLQLTTSSAGGNICQLKLGRWGVFLEGTLVKSGTQREAVHFGVHSFSDKPIKYVLKTRGFSIPLNAPCS